MPMVALMLRRDFLRGSLLSLPFVTHSVAQASQATSTICPAARQDELWVVSSRSFGCVDPNDSNRQTWQVQRRETNTNWQNAQFDEFTAASQDGLHTVFYVHGNRNDCHWAMKNGQTVYNALVRQSAPDQRFRFVIYSWPSDQIRGPVRDGRFKLQVANNETYRLGWLMTQLSAKSQYGLIGFSLGGRIITGGMHLLAGGILHGKTLTPGTRPATRAVLWAPAVHNDWLLPGHYHGNAMNALDRISVMYNTKDPVMKRYHMGEPGGHPTALGFSGFSSLAQFGSISDRVEQQEVCQLIGKSHELVQYAGTESIVSKARKQVFWM
jgi:hypothetical protein